MTDTSHIGIMTDPDCLGPCEPGTSVVLEGIVWQETENGTKKVVRIHLPNHSVVVVIGVDIMHCLYQGESYFAKSISVNIKCWECMFTEACRILIKF